MSGRCRRHDFGGVYACSCSSRASCGRGKCTHVHLLHAIQCVGEMYADSRICASSGLWPVPGNCWSCAVLASLQSSGSAGAGSSSWAHRYLPGAVVTRVASSGGYAERLVPTASSAYVWPRLCLATQPGHPHNGQLNILGSHWLPDRLPLRDPSHVHSWGALGGLSLCAWLQSAGLCCWECLTSL
jgi:hypothetical protein